MEKTTAFILGGLLIVAGLLYTLVPETALALTGQFQLDSSALLDARASYGGFQFGLGLALLIAALKSQPRPVLNLTALLLFSVGGIRAVGYGFSEGAEALHLLAACVELTAALLLTVLVSRRTATQ